LKIFCEVGRNDLFTILFVVDGQCLSLCFINYSLVAGIMNSSVLQVLVREKMSQKSQTNKQFTCYEVRVDTE